MADKDKKYTAQEVALAVLAKAGELLAKSDLVKAETGHEKGIRTQVNSPAFKQGTSHAGANIRPQGIGGKAAVKEAKTQSKDNLAEMKGMTKPSLPKSEDLGKKENPDEKQDAKLGEEVEHLCEDHMLDNKEAERKEGHKIVQKSECIKCNMPSPSPATGQGTTLKPDAKKVAWLEKSEFEDLMGDLKKMEDLEKREKGVHNPHKMSMEFSGSKPKGGESDAGFSARYHNEYGSKAIKDTAKKEHKKVLGEMKDMPKPNLPKSEDMGKAETENKKSPSNSMKPRVKEEGVERDYNDFEPKTGAPSKSSTDDHRQAPQASPAANPKEQVEGNNPEAGSAPGERGPFPGKGIHKLAHFMGHTSHKRSMKKGICLG